VAPEDVDLIIATHAHPDHIGGLVAGGAAVFTNAEMVISDVDHRFWSDAAMMAQAPAEAQGMFGFAVA
jgi:glyoxylase-like metal-dependent hydrolase (beta-lactamase superfamily II)